jgi:hypothetical protein
VTGGKRPASRARLCTCTADDEVGGSLRRLHAHVRDRDGKVGGVGFLEQTIPDA